MAQEKIIVRGGRVIDPAQGIDRASDVLVSEGKIEEVTDAPLPEAPSGYRVVDSTGFVVSPGFIDLHTHLRDPGLEWKETIETGAKAAARGGFTTICAMPNTDPCQDSASVVEDVLRRASQDADVRVLAIGAITVGRRGKSLAPMGELAETGVIGFSDDGDPVMDPNVMRQALQYAAELGLPIINHAEDKTLVRGGVMNESDVATRLGLPGAPSQAETVMIARDIELCALTGGRLHVPHVSTRASVELIRSAKERELNVTAEVTPHHLMLDHNWIYGLHGETPDVLSPTTYDTNSKVNPPLRSPDDVAAVTEGLADRTIDIIATDHAPHADTDKVCTFNEAAHGINVLETAFGQVMKLVHAKSITLSDLIDRMSGAPAAILGKNLGALKVGYPADITLIDPDAEWTVKPETFASKSRNTPLAGVTLKGKVVTTIVGGEVVSDDRKAMAGGARG